MSADSDFYSRGILIPKMQIVYRFGPWCHREHFIQSNCILVCNCMPFPLSAPYSKSQLNLTCSCFSTACLWSKLMFGNNPADFCFCSLPAKLAKSSDDSDWQCTIFLVLWLWWCLEQLVNFFEDAFEYKFLWGVRQFSTCWRTHWLWLCIEQRRMPLLHEDPQCSIWIKSLWSRFHYGPCSTQSVLTVFYVTQAPKGSSDHTGCHRLE